VDSRRWLAALSAIAALLLLALWLTRPGGAPAGGRVVPDFDERAVYSIAIGRPDTGAVVSLSRDVERPERWQLNDRFAKLVADPAAVRELLGTIEMLSIQRRDDGAVDPALRVSIMRHGGRNIELAFEATGGATDRVWASRAGQRGRFLVDGYAVRALAVGVQDLRETRPLRGRLHGATAITIATGDRQVELTGPPWRLADGTRVDPSSVRSLEDELERLRMTSFAAAAAGVRSGLIVIEATGSGSAVELGGACAGVEGRAVLASPIGTGCVDEDAIEAILRRADPHGPLVDRRPIAAGADDVTAIHLRRGDRAITITAAEKRDTLRAWLGDLAAAPTGEVADATGFAPAAAIDVDVDGGAHESFEVGRAAGAPALRRAGEGVVLLLAPTAADLFEPSPHRFHSLELVARDASDLSAASRPGGESIARGETLEEWRALRPPGAAVDAAAADALAAAAADLRATRVDAARAAPRHGFGRHGAIDLAFDPPPGSTTAERHALELGAASASGGCFARIDGDPVVFELSADRCAALAGPWTR
jgi:hypothetical protein